MLKNKVILKFNFFCWMQIALIFAALLVVTMARPNNFGNFGNLGGFINPASMYTIILIKY